MTHAWAYGVSPNVFEMPQGARLPEGTVQRLRVLVTEMEAVRHTGFALPSRVPNQLAPAQVAAFWSR